MTENPFIADSKPVSPLEVNNLDLNKQMLDLAKDGAVSAIAPDRFDSAFGALATLEQNAPGSVDISTFKKALNNAAKDPNSDLGIRMSGGQTADGTSFSYVDFPPNALGQGVVGSDMSFRKEYNGRFNVIKMQYAWGDPVAVETPDKAGSKLNMSVNDIPVAFDGAEIQSGFQYAARALEELSKAEVNLQPIAAELLAKAAPAASNI